MWDFESYLFSQIKRNVLNLKMPNIQSTQLNSGQLFKRKKKHVIVFNLSQVCLQPNTRIVNRWGSTATSKYWTLQHTNADHCSKQILNTTTRKYWKLQHTIAKYYNVQILSTAAIKCSILQQANTQQRYKFHAHVVEQYTLYTVQGAIC